MLEDSRIIEYLRSAADLCNERRHQHGDESTRIKCGEIFHDRFGLIWFTCATDVNKKNLLCHDEYLP